MSITITLPTAEDPPGLLAGSSLLIDLMDDDKGLDDIVEKLDPFALVNAKLISLANSAWSAPVQEITNLKDACARLGLGVVRSITIGLAVGRAFDTKACPSFDATRYWTTSLLGGELASVLSGGQQHDAATARVATLLYSIGLLWFADKYPEQTEQALARCAQEPAIAVTDALEDVFDVNHVTAGRALLAAWKMPSVLTDALWCPSLDSAPGTLGHVAHAASSLASWIYSGADELHACSQSWPDNDYQAAFDQGARALDRTRCVAESLFAA